MKLIDGLECYECTKTNCGDTYAKNASHITTCSADSDKYCEVNLLVALTTERWLHFFWYFWFFQKNLKIPKTLFKFLNSFLDILMKKIVQFIFLGYNFKLVNSIK